MRNDPRTRGRLAAWLALLLVATALAGCNDDPGDDPGEASDGGNDGGNDGGADGPDAGSPEAIEPEASGDTLQVWEHQAQYPVEVQATRTGVLNAGIGGVNGANCMMLEGVNRIVSGEASATWDAITPLSDRLEIRLAGDESVFAEGASGVAITIDGLEPDGGSYALMLQPTNPGVAIAQPATIDIRFTYEALEPLQVDTGWSCSYG